MSDCTDGVPTPTPIADALRALGPRTVEGDQGRVTMHSVSDAIKAQEYTDKRDKMKNKAGVRAVLRTISGHRLLNHDGPAT